MYPKNAASPPQIALGAVVQISDGAVQTTGISIAVSEAGAAEGAGDNSATVGGSSSVVYYTPSQTETNNTYFTVTAYKSACIPVSQTIVTTDTATPGRVAVSGTKDTLDDLNDLGGTAQTADHTAAIADIPTVSEFNTKLPNNLNTTATGNIGVDWANVENPTTALNLSATNIDVDQVVASVSGAVSSVTGGATEAKQDTAQNDLDIITGSSGVNLLTATQASIDAIELDTGTTLDGKIDTIGTDTAATNTLAEGATGFAAIDTVVDLILVDTADMQPRVVAIEVDTGTTLDGKIDTIDTNVDAVKAKTDDLTFTKANEIDANIKSINDVEIVGDGSATPYDVP